MYICSGDVETILNQKRGSIHTWKENRGGQIENKVCKLCDRSHIPQQRASENSGPRCYAKHSTYTTAENIPPLEEIYSPIPDKHACAVVKRSVVRQSLSHELCRTTLLVLVMERIVFLKISTSSRPRPVPRYTKSRQSDSTGPGCQPWIRTDMFYGTISIRNHSDRKRERKERY